MLRQAEADLARGDAIAALEGFERVNAAGHEAEGELGLVRAAMQAGLYRRALAFCAHVAGEHAELADAGVLYAWLLRVGGQREASERVLAATLARMPTDPVAVAARQALAAPLPIAAGILLEAPHRLAPVATAVPGPAADTVPAAARVVASGVLVDGGRRALVPSDDRLAASRVWVRNGLGETRRAAIDASSGAAQGGPIRVLHLADPIAGDVAIAARDPFAGSPGFAAVYADDVVAEPAWPQLGQGFFGGPLGSDGTRRLGFEIAGSRRQGGPVLDAGGALAGMVLAGDGGPSRLWPVSLWPRLDRDSRGPAHAASVPSAGQRRRISTDEAYELILRIALQVLVAP